MSKLSHDLWSIYQLELDKGNEVASINEPAGTKCPYAVVFARPLHKAEIETELNLSPFVKYWESRDSHYPKEAGFYSEVSGHAIAGPINGA
jgi:hypothetical protein